ncbi:MAG TPA: DUF4149 domain-containing protein [Myxococcales bacterium]|nr:DUF4149 domain-containing protein [Myxococcales bacterium]
MAPAMMRVCAYLYRLAAGLLLGAQVYFALIAAPAAFPREIAALPAGHPLRTAAANLVGAQLATLDRMTLLLCAVAALSAIALARAGAPSARVAALPVLLTGLCALASSQWVTPRIHQLRAASQTNLPEFGRLHALSTSLLGVEIVLLLVALWVAPERAKG